MKRSITSLLSILIYVPVLATFFEAEPPGAATYEFFLDGRAVRPPVWSLRGTPEKPEAGDVVRIGDLLLTLDDPGRYEFRTTPEEDGRLMLKAEDGRERVIGALVRWTYKGDQKVVFNPLARLTDQEVRGLRGVSIGEWTDQVAARFKFIDPQRACVTIWGETGQEPRGTPPPLPASVAYLYLDLNSGNRITDLSALEDQSNLRFLVLDGLCAKFDAALLQQASHLSYLDLSGNEIVHPMAIASLKELRHLDLAYCEGLSSLAFVSGLDRLVELGLQGTAVDDLTPLDGLGSLATLVANRTRATRLPRGPLTALRRVEVMSTRLQEADVAAFIAAHPGCQVRFHWDLVLRDALKGITRLRVRSDGMNNSATDKTLLDVKVRAQITELIDLIRIDEAVGESHCMCCGAPVLEFYRDDALAVTLSVHHGKSLRWSGVWPGDGWLTEASADAVCTWLAVRGAPGARDERNAIKRAAAAAQ